MSSNGHGETRGYIYARLWVMPLIPVVDPDWDEIISLDFSDGYKIEQHEQGRYSYTDIPDTIWYITIGKTIAALQGRYKGEKSLKPIREWEVIVEHPKRHEDRLRVDFKKFLANSMYEIIPSRGRYVYHSERKHNHPYLNEDEERGIFNIFGNSQQKSTDVFVIPIPHQVEYYFRLNAYILLCTFFNTYFDAIGSHAIVHARQGTLI